MPNIVPILDMLGLPVTAGVAEILDAIREHDRMLSTERKRANDLNSLLGDSQDRLRRAEDPTNWRVQFTGDEAYDDPITTPLVHGNYVSIEGSGQVMLHFRPCCQNIKCRCEKRREVAGTCVCAADDPIDYAVTRCMHEACNNRVPTSKRPASREDGFCSDICKNREEVWGK